MNYTIKRLKNDDIEALRSLNQLFSDVFEEPGNYQANPPSDAYLQKFLADERHVVLVAMEGANIIGGMVAYHLTKFEQERSEVYVYDLAVAKNQQGNGVGTALMRHVQHLAHEIGAYVVFLQADIGDRAVEFYRSLNPSEDSRAVHFDFPAQPNNN